MSALLTGNLPLIADAPDGIRKLRGLILDLAVRGKLVPQDAGDEPARELLNRIAQERTQSETRVTRKKSAPPPVTRELEPSFALPQGWEWASVGELSSLVRGVSYNKSQAAATQLAGYIPLLRGHNINQHLNFEDLVYVPGELISNDQLVRLGDIVIALSSGSAHLVGKAAQVDKNVTCGIGAFCGVVRAHSIELYQYFGLFFQTPYYRHRVAAHGKGIGINNLQKGALLALECPLPPLPEQHRIVAKVDELMALCDRLEAEQADAEAAHARLVDALLTALARSTDAADFAANWQRLAAHFDTLFTTEAAIDALKQTVLQLAVMGKLVPQDPNDEPASELLDWITVERSGLEAAGKIRKSKPLQEIEDAAQPFPLPPNWAWARLGEVTLESGAGWSPNCESRRRENDEWGVLKVSAVSWGIFKPDENKALPSNLQPRPDCEVVQGDFLVSRANTAELVARSVWVESCPQRLMLSDKIVRLKLSQHMNGRFVNLANTCAHARSYYAAVAGGTSSSMKNVSREQILNLAIPLPPIAEQHRIVARFNELTALCDRLKADLARARQRQATLADTLIAAALEAA